MEELMLQCLDINVIVTPIYKNGNFSVSFTYDEKECIKKGVTIEELEAELKIEYSDNENEED